MNRIGAPVLLLVALCWCCVGVGSAVPSEKRALVANRGRIVLRWIAAAVGTKAILFLLVVVGLPNLLFLVMMDTDNMHDADDASVDHL